MTARSAIADATNATYTLTAGDVNAAVRVLVTATNPDGTATAASRATGHDPERRAGQHRQAGRQRHRAARSTLTGTAGTWSGIGNSTSFQWQSSTDGSTWTAISVGDRLRRTRSASATSGSYLRLLVTVTNPEGTASAASTATAKVIGAPPVNTVSRRSPAPRSARPR